jgi:arabinofuranan 3-O-arabinosyltransferase
VTRPDALWRRQVTVTRLYRAVTTAKYSFAVAPASVACDGGAGWRRRDLADLRCSGGTMHPTTVRTGTDDTTSRTVARLRSAAVCVGLTALAFSQSPGVTVPDTKVDLTVNPAGWLSHALHLWQPAAMFGQVQDQAYGYLWPMGPFFLAGTWLGMPSWVIQRLWWAVVFCVAYSGVVKLASLLKLGTPDLRILGGVAFALSPRLLTMIGASSVEAWPSAVAPWVLVPLIGLADGRRLRRPILLSALAVAAAGGVNATAVFAVVPLAGIWLLGLVPLRRRLAAFAGWCVAVAAATVWWIVPLLVLGRYSPPFLDYIESARITTSITDPVTVLRGASYWVAYLAGPYGLAMPAGGRLAGEPLLVAASIALAVLGVAGLSRRGMPHRTFLLAGLLCGLALVGLGHVGSLPGTFAGAQQRFLDGIGAPLRNTHKFDVLIRLPLTLGLIHLMHLIVRSVGTVGNRPRAVRLRAGVVMGTAVAAVVAVASPALAGHLAPDGGYKKVPGYWQDAANWLDAHAGRDHVLVVPGARFPTYDWGRTTDEISQPLLDASWAVRNAIPFTPPTTIRMLDAIDTVLSSGRGSDGLADLLARSGIRYVLARSDLDYGRTGTPPPLVVRQALQRSPGLTPVAAFGPNRGGSSIGGVFRDHALDVPVPALQVYRVDRMVDSVVAYNAKDVATVVGGPESLLDLAAAGQLSSAPAILAGDRADSPPTGPTVLTDGLRRRDVWFGQARDNASQTLAANESFDTPAPAHDYLPPWGEQALTTVRYANIESVRASSSWSQAGLVSGSRPEHQPYAAMDGDPATSWQAAPGSDGTHQWWEVTLATPAVVTSVVLHFDLSANAVPTKVTVSAGEAIATVEGFGAQMTVPVNASLPARTVLIEINDVFGKLTGAGSVGISEVEMTGLTPGRTLVPPTPPPTEQAPTILLNTAPATPACFFADGQARCAPEFARGSEDGYLLDRTVDLPTGGEYQPALWVTPRAGPALDALLDDYVTTKHPLEISATVTASSTQLNDPAARPGAVVDGDPSTAWSPSPTEESPFLHLSWPAPREVTGVQLRLAPGVAASQPGAVQVISDEGVRGGLLDATGTVRFPPVTTDELSILFVTSSRAQSLDSYGNSYSPVPVAIGEITVLPDLPQPPISFAEPLQLPCGSGPLIILNGVAVKTKLTVTVRELLEQREVPAIPCLARGAAIDLPTGERHVMVRPSALATPARLLLTPSGRAAAAPASSPMEILKWTGTDRRLRIGPSAVDRVIAVRENINPGWRATVAGVTLAPITIDGWQQGYLLPANVSGDIHLQFTADHSYRIALGAGGLLLAGLMVVAILPVRRRPSASVQAFLAQLSRRQRTRNGSGIAIALGAVALVAFGGFLGGLIVMAGVVLLGARPILVDLSARRQRRIRRFRATVEPALPMLLVGLAGVMSMNSGNRYVALWPQVCVLAAVGLLWLSQLWPAIRPQVRQLHERPFDQVIAERGHDQRAGQRQSGNGYQPAGEPWSVPAQVDRFDYQRMPQENPVGQQREPM